MYKESGENKVHELDWTVSDGEIDEYQQHILTERAKKTAGSEEDVKKQLARVSQSILENGAFKYSYEIE